MSVAITNNKIFELAKEIAEQAGMQCDDEHIQTARKRLQIAAFDDRLQKRVAAPTGEDEELLQKAIEAQFQRRDPHAVGLGGPPHQRIEIGEVETREHGRLRIARSHRWRYPGRA